MSIPRHPPVSARQTLQPTELQPHDAVEPIAEDRREGSREARTAAAGDPGGALPCLPMIAEGLDGQNLPVSRRSSRGEIFRHLADIARLYGWRYHRSSPSLTPEGYTDGFPSSVLVRDGRLVFVAISGRKLTPPEAAWADELSRVSTVEMHVIRRENLAALTHALRPGAQDAPGELPLVTMHRGRAER